MARPLVLSGEEQRYKLGGIIDSLNYLFPIELESHESKTYFLHIQNKYLTQLPTIVNTLHALFKYERVTNLFIGTYFGLMAVMFFYNLFLFVTVRDVAYLLSYGNSTFNFLSSQ